jgi:hypothetical protein
MLLSQMLYYDDLLLFPSEQSAFDYQNKQYAKLFVNVNNQSPDV